MLCTEDKLFKQTPPLPDRYCYVGKACQECWRQSGATARDTFRAVGGGDAVIGGPQQLHNAELHGNAATCCEFMTHVWLNCSEHFLFV